MHTGKFEPALLAQLQLTYGLETATIRQLDLGADFDARVYLIDQRNGGRSFFLKLWTAAAVEASVSIPYFLRSQGVCEVLEPIPAKDGKLISTFGDMQFIMYPFVQGQTAMDAGLTMSQWDQLGEALKAIHRTCALETSDL